MRSKTDGIKSLLYLLIAFIAALATSSIGTTAIATAITAGLIFNTNFRGIYPIAIAFAVNGELAFFIAVEENTTNILYSMLGGAVIAVVAFITVLVVGFIIFRWKAFFKWFLFTLSFLFYFLGIVYWLGTVENIRKEYLPVLLFFGLLPLVNAPFDWVSLGVTRSLLYNITDKVHNGFVAVLWSLFDILIALLLLLGIVVASTIVIAGANHLFQLGGHYEFIIDLNNIFSDLRNNPYDSRYWWLYMIFLSTLVPTIIHLIVAAWAVVMWVPSKILDGMGTGWADDQMKNDFPKLLGTTLYFSVFLPIAVLSPIILLYFFHVMFFQEGYAFVIGETLLDSMEALAMFVDPSMKG